MWHRAKCFSFGVRRRAAVLHRSLLDPPTLDPVYCPTGVSHKKARTRLERNTDDSARSRPIDPNEFISRWKASGGAERSNYQLFLSELCDVLGVPRPEPAVDNNTQNRYVFDHTITFSESDGKTTTNFIDLYKRGCFVLETKQGVEKQEAEAALSDAGKLAKKKKKKGHGVRGTAGWNLTMKAAHGQAEGYARGLPATDGRPPFVVVIDVGHCIELYSEFTRTGGSYVAFPDQLSHRIPIEKLADPDVRETLRTLWTDPMALDPSRKSAKVTREIADKLAKLAKALEADKHNPEDVAAFLMRCLFTMFAEDVGLLPKDGFTNLLERIRETPEGFKPTMVQLWKTMNDGGFSPLLLKNILRFNGGLFKGQHALDLNADQVQLLLEAAKANWSEVEPAIFGTLLERALDPRERHKLGAHYTPRAYVERLVIPTIVEPLRDEWNAAQAAAVIYLDNDEPKKARKELEAFHEHLCNVRILDPACGSGNFLYVALEHLKRIEGEVLDLMTTVEGGQSITDIHGRTVDPHQLLGIEINPRAAVIAELVLWIGYLQWHHRIHGEVNPPEPVIKDFKNIECRDAILAYDDKRIVIDPETNKPRTRWDGRTTKPHPVTGEEVPDESAREPIYEYTNPRKAEWPEADYVAGNPPFIGASKMRESLGDGYVGALRSTYRSLGESVDYVMYWWSYAAELLEQDSILSFGLITTNGIRQRFNRRVLDGFLRRKSGFQISFAIPDHPWVDSSDGAAVRISMTAASRVFRQPALYELGSDSLGDDGKIDVSMGPRTGRINSALRIGPDIASISPLSSNEDLCNEGVKPHGMGFVVSTEQAISLGLGKSEKLESYIRPYFNGSDISQIPRGKLIIDLFALSLDELAAMYPKVHQWVLERVKPDRDAKSHSKDGAVYAKFWWKFGKPRPALRDSVRKLDRYIVTVKTSRHRHFVFLPKLAIPDSKLIAIASSDAYTLGVLSSSIHFRWMIFTCGWQGVGNDPVYVKSLSFDAFPFPDATDAQKARIRDLGERLDAHRKARQAEHPKLTMTGMYNVLEKLRSGETLTKKDKEIHDQGLVTILKEIHDELDAAVFDAYGWPTDLSDEEILERLVALNLERADEEKRGIIRWLRPEFQNPQGDAPTQTEGIAAVETTAKKTKTKKKPWPKGMAAQAKAVREALTTINGPATVDDIAASFSRAKKQTIEDLLDTLTELGQSRQTEDGRYVAQ